VEWGYNRASDLQLDLKDRWKFEDIDLHFRLPALELNGVVKEVTQPVVYIEPVVRDIDQKLGEDVFFYTNAWLRFARFAIWPDLLLRFAIK
jgi:hypothetical protein